MQEKGYDRDQQQCCVKVKEPQQANQKCREANGQSSEEPQTCCFYKELHAILGGEPTTTSQTTIGTAEEPETQTPAMNSEEEDGRHATSRVQLCHNSGPVRCPHSPVSPGTCTWVTQCWGRNLGRCRGLEGFPLHTCRMLEANEDKEEDSG